MNSGILKERSKEAGSAMIEFSLVGIPLLFAIVSIIEIGRGMWIYRALSHAVQDGARFSMVKGQGCSLPPNACASTVQQIAQRIRNSSPGLDPAVFTVTLTSTSATIGPQPLSTLLTDTTYFPSSIPGGTPPAGSAPGQPVTVTGTYPFRSAIAMLWPSSGKMQFGTFVFPATARELIQF
jgi:Flp pilus assembly protein TadG